MRFLVFLFSGLAMSLLMIDPAAAAEEAPKQFYEVRTYIRPDASSDERLDAYFGDALVPALQRAGAGPVGVFAETGPDAGPNLYVVITYAAIEDVQRVRQAIADDSAYQRAANAYLDRGRDQPLFERIESELLEAFDVMPQAAPPESVGTVESRVYELRIYESATERLGELKVEMFNEGEVPIFLDSGIIPVFFGEAIVGPRTPNLTYLTAYPDDAARLSAWDKFREHPDWKTLSAEPRYAGTVSKIHKYVLAAKPYSQL